MANTSTLSNQELTDAIALWQPKISTDPQLMEAAFFAIYVEFDKFLNAALVHYATGGATLSGNYPPLRLCFADEKHFKDVVGAGANKFEINVLDLFFSKKQLWNDIMGKANLFEVIFSDAKFSTPLPLMRNLRNFIAHKSPESREKYRKTCLNDKNFIEPYDYLNAAYSKANPKPCYELFTETMKDISELILDPIP